MAEITKLEIKSVYCEDEMTFKMISSFSCIINIKIIIVHDGISLEELEKHLKNAENISEQNVN